MKSKIVAIFMALTLLFSFNLAAGPEEASASNVWHCSPTGAVLENEAGNYFVVVNDTFCDGYHSGQIHAKLYRSNGSSLGSATTSLRGTYGYVQHRFYCNPGSIYGIYGVMGVTVNGVYQYDSTAVGWFTC